MKNFEEFKTHILGRFGKIEWIKPNTVHEKYYKECLKLEYLLEFLKYAHN